ncbi:MAG: helix-turn-helix transcriptional regulator [Bacteroidota bacterium]
MQVVFYAQVASDSCVEIGSGLLSGTDVIRDFLSLFASLFIDCLSLKTKQARTDKKLSQQQLAQAANVHYTNVGRYERGDAKPSAEVLNRLANALEVSPDYLMNGTLDDKAESSLSDQELLLQFKKVEQMPEDRKRLLKEVIDAFLL